MTADRRRRARPPSRARAEPPLVRRASRASSSPDSRRALLLREPGRIPVYYFRARTCGSRRSRRPATPSRAPARGGGRVLVGRGLGDRTGGARRVELFRSAAEPTPAARPRRRSSGRRWTPGSRRTTVYVHAAIRTSAWTSLHSSRHVKVVVAGQVVAESRRPCAPVRDGTAHCATICRRPTSGWTCSSPPTPRRGAPTRGTASYYRCGAGPALVRDIAWYYRRPILECSKIENLVCFFDERVDAVYVDGELQARPEARWSVTATGEPAAGAPALDRRPDWGRRQPVRGPGAGPAGPRGARRSGMWQAIRCVGSRGLDRREVSARRSPRPSRAARVEAAAGRRVSPRSAPPIQADAHAALRVRHRDRRQEGLRVGMIGPGEHFTRLRPTSHTRPRYITAIVSER